MRSLALAVLVALPALAAAAQPVPPGTRLDGIAAVVGDQVVLYSEVDALAPQLAQGEPVTDDLWSRALDRLVGQRVVISEARQDTTISVTEARVTRAAQEQVARLAQQAGGEAQLEAAYGRTLGEIETSLRDDVRDEILLQTLQQRRMQGVTVTPGEVQSWFSQIPQADRPEVPELVRVAHIVQVPAPDETAKAERRALLQSLRDSVVSDQATIEELANRYSTDPGNTGRDGTKNGGLYTDLRLSEVEARFRAATAALDPGEYSQVIETPFGYHLIRLNELEGDRVSFNHILLDIPSGAREAEQARETLRVLRDSVLAGVPFEGVARRNSEDPYSAQRGGFVSDPESGQRDLNVDGLGAQWKATIDSLDVGEISEPAPVKLLDQTDAYHVVLLQKRTPAHTLSVADDYALLSQYALQDKRLRAQQEWVDDLRRRVYVDVRAPRYEPAGG
ncbi:peptidylprolyl isomerase [Rubrivirga sp. S365]|uniref:peptidylprolyl isomerase n=1 Tax=Rubrivirga sp. S365 TaxID=3076080 RepID=UPI0028C88409|nr:peptidylprolyl isomerase [Rubrivirga sp. S365]MDT7857005.1 peptidylprolyl isomerase [Rubrivirga sp. S365]